MANRLLSMTDESGTTTYTYDELGRVKTKLAPGFTMVTYGYDMTAGCAEGCHYETISDESGLTRNWYDKMNRLVKVQNGDSVSEITYYRDGARKSVTYADGTTETYTYNGTHNVTSVTNTLADKTVQDKFVYTYDKAGNLKEKTEVSAGVERGTTTYEYDVQNRLYMVQYPDGTLVTYSYDDAGNRKTMIETVEVELEDGTPYTATVITEYFYNDRNQLTSLTETVGDALVSKTVYTYDANGNQLTEKKTEYNATGKSTGTTTVLSNTYDLHNQLVRSVTEDAVINNTYNAAGYRVTKKVTEDGKTSEKNFLYDGRNVIMESDENDDITAKNVYGGPLLFRNLYDDNGTKEETYSYLYNAHGDVVTLLSDSEVTATYVYDAFGNIKDQTGETDNSILYAGYQYDEETGLYYLNARMYDPVTARFLQADTYLGEMNDPLSLNLYTYCFNNPERYIDPSGHVALSLAVAIISAIVLGMVVEVGIQKFVEKRVCIDYDKVVTEGLFSGLISVFLCGGGSMISVLGRTTARGVKVAKTAGSVAKSVASVLARAAVTGAAAGAIEEVAHQYIVEGRKISQLDYRRIGISAAVGAVLDTGASAIRAGVRQLKAVRAARVPEYTTRIVGDVMPEGTARTATTGGYIGGQRMLKMDLQFFAESADETANNGAARAAKYSSEWGDASLNEAINRFAPNVEPVTTPKGKIIYNNTETGISVVYDKYGNYFRIEDTARPRGRNYLDIYGNDMNNEIVNGKARGRSKADYQRVTHFNNSDK